MTRRAWLLPAAVALALAGAACAARSADPAVDLSVADARRLLAGAALDDDEGLELAARGPKALAEAAEVEADGGGLEVVEGAQADELGDVTPAPRRTVPPAVGAEGGAEVAIGDEAAEAPGELARRRGGAEMSAGAEAGQGVGDAAPDSMQEFVGRRPGGEELVRRSRLGGSEEEGGEDDDAEPRDALRDLLRWLEEDPDGGIGDAEFAKIAGDLGAGAFEEGGDDEDWLGSALRWNDADDALAFLKDAEHFEFLAAEDLADGSSAAAGDEAEPPAAQGGAAGTEGEAAEAAEVDV